MISLNSGSTCHLIVMITGLQVLTPKPRLVSFHVPAVSTDAPSFSPDISSFCIKLIFSEICLFKSLKKYICRPAGWLIVFYPGHLSMSPWRKEETISSKLWPSHACHVMGIDTHVYACAHRDTHTQSKCFWIYLFLKNFSCHQLSLCMLWLYLLSCQGKLSTVLQWRLWIITLDFSSDTHVYYCQFPVKCSWHCIPYILIHCISNFILFKIF